MTRVTGSAGCGPLKLMIVEDEALIAMSLEDILIELGHEVMCVAYTVEEAVSALDRPGPAPQAVILDANLGGRSALPVADRLRAAGIPFLLATGYGEDHVRRLGLGEPVMPKPYSKQQLRQVLAQVVGPDPGPSLRRSE